MRWNRSLFTEVPGVWNSRSWRSQEVREKRAAQFLRMREHTTHAERASNSVTLRDFESILLFLSEEEIEELQAAIDERRSRRLAREEEEHGPGAVEQPVYSSSVGVEELLEVHTRIIAPVQMG
jgi:hypothetical protein